MPGRSNLASPRNEPQISSLLIAKNDRHPEGSVRGQPPLDSNIEIKISSLEESTTVSLSNLNIRSELTGILDFRIIIFSTTLSKQKNAIVIKKRISIEEDFSLTECMKYDRHERSVRMIEAMAYL